MIEPIYENSRVTLYCGDCLEIMPQLDITFDCCITDPPYQTTGIQLDMIIPFEPMWKQLNRLVKENGQVILFSSQPFTTDLINSNRKNFSYEVIWKKNTATGFSQAKYRPMKYHENILLFNATRKSTYNPIMQERTQKQKDSYKYNHYCGKNNHCNLQKVKIKYDMNKIYPSSIVSFNGVPNRNGKVHPTQKPVSLIEYLIKTYTNENDTILDFTSGSGTTGVACMNTNRKCVLIEKQAKYCEITIQRLQDKEKEIAERLF